ncbi:hypothetical protein C8Q75DRAFT_597298 [Abortiporus biennis]|nr:hypothetical protein C8Q75DRAFT_597298 [Abortiporus biennis]
MWGNFTRLNTFNTALKVSRQYDFVSHCDYVSAVQPLTILLFAVTEVSSVEMCRGVLLSFYILKLVLTTRILSGLQEWTNPVTILTVAMFFGFKLTFFTHTTLISFCISWSIIWCTSSTLLKRVATVVNAMSSSITFIGQGFFHLSCNVRMVPATSSNGMLLSSLLLCSLVMEFLT